MSDFGTIHEMVTCPYNKSHQVGASKFASHLLKCRKQNAVGGMLICEYNQLHHVPADQMDEHLKSCQEYLNNQHHLLITQEKDTRSATETHGNSFQTQTNDVLAHGKEQQAYPYDQDDW